MVMGTGRFVLAALAVFVATGTASFANTTVPGKAMRVHGPSGLVVFVMSSSALDKAAKAQETNHSLTTDQALTNYYKVLVSNPAVSGLLIGTSWATLNPSEGTYDWTILKNAFDVVSAWNATHSTQKFVQVAVSSGFYSAPWIFDPSHIKGGSCDALFMSPPPKEKAKPSCGYTNIFLETESGTPTAMMFPIPWNKDYRNLWKTFLTKLATYIRTKSYRHGGKSIPYSDSFASISVGGPTASSNEIILPHDGKAARVLPSSEGDTISGVTDLVAWDMLLANHYGASSPYVDSDQAFVEAWQATIDMYGKVFTEVTLTLATGAGLPNFPKGIASTPPSGFGSADCSATPSMDCAAEATIVAYFSQQTSGGSNAKVVAQLGQQTDRRGAFPLSGLSIEWLTANTSAGLTELTGSTTVLSHMYGGLQLTGAASAASSPEGCVSAAGTASPCTPEQSLYDVLQLIFRGTPVAGDYGEPTTIATPAFSNAPLNYLQVYAGDILYASGMSSCSDADLMGGTCVATTMPAVSIVEVDERASAITTSTASVAAQSLLASANEELLKIAEPPLVYVPIPVHSRPTSCPGGGPRCQY